MRGVNPIKSNNLRGMQSNLTGKTFGKLIAIRSTDLRYNNQVVWECICTCDNRTVLVRSSSLTNGDTTSCGCVQRSIAKKRGQRHATVASAAIACYYRVYKYTARNRELEFNISIDDFKQLIVQPCHYCGTRDNYVSVNVGRKLRNGKLHANGIDRADSSLGYTLSNCRPCCKVCNIAKQSLTEQQFINLCERIVQYQKLKGG